MYDGVKKDAGKAGFKKSGLTTFPSKHTGGKPSRRRWAGVNVTHRKKNRA